jgi:hypothetical protein
MTKIIVTLRNFAKEPKKLYFLLNKMIITKRYVAAVQMFVITVTKQAP